MDDPSPAVAVVMAQLRMLDAQRLFEMTQAALAAALVEQAKARVARDAAQGDRDDRQQILTDAVTNAYVRGGMDTGTNIAPTASEYLPVESARLLAGNAIERDQRMLEQAADRLRATERVLADATTRAGQAKAAHDAAQTAIDEATKALSDARRLTNAKDVSPTVMGDAVLTADELVGWYKSKGVAGYVGGVDLPTMAGLYIEEGKAEQIRGDVAWAQSVVETGAFTSPLTTHNNFAGIGACDSCATGFDFASPKAGVRAQAQLLHAYADKMLRIATLANPAVGSNPDHLSVRGCCPTWNKLTGTWATDPNYGPKLMTVYLSMLQFALVPTHPPGRSTARGHPARCQPPLPRLPPAFP